MTDILQNRREAKWSKKALAGRVLWGCLYPLFRLSPRPLWGWRCMLLRLTGAKIGKNVHIHPTVRITIPWNLNIADMAAIGDHAILYALGPITIGRVSTISQYAHICAGSHNFRDGKMTLTKPPIIIGDDVWIGADAFIGPNVVIEDKSLIGARAVITNNVPENSVFAGNPAKKINARYKSDVEI